ncbi:MAG: hypothetical protein ABI977_03985 [Acidobacteriota bacterium]
MTTSQLELIVDQVKLLPPGDLAELIKRTAEVLEQKQKPTDAMLKDEGIDLQAFGIDQAQAAELRDSFATFEDWNDSEMDIYNDYDASKSALDAKV